MAAASCVQGNHRVEQLLFSARDVAAAQWWAADLLDTSALSDSLDARCSGSL